MGNLIMFLSGKKTTIATIIGALIMFATTRGYIAKDVAELLSTIMIALGLTANYATKLHYDKVVDSIIGGYDVKLVARKNGKKSK